MVTPDPHAELKQAIMTALSRPIGDIAAWADDMIRWLDTHGWRPPVHVPDWRQRTPAVEPTDEFRAARAATRTTPPQEHP